MARWHPPHGYHRLYLLRRRVDCAVGRLDLDTMDHPGIRQYPTWGTILLASTVGACVPGFLGLVGVFGWRIPQPEIHADYLVGLAWSVLLGLSIFVWPVSRGDRFALVLIWIIKSAVTLGFMLLYEYKYGLDAYMYFELSAKGEVPWDHVGMGSGTANILALCWLQHQVIPPSYHALKVSFAMAGLVGIFLFYRGAVIFLGREQIQLLWALALFPSILFWSSILGKDPVVLLGICLYAYGVLGWVMRRRKGYLLAIIAGVLIASAIRIWMGPILLVPLMIVALRALRGGMQRLGFVALVGVVFIITLKKFLGHFALATVQDLVETANFMSESFAEGGSAQQWGGGLDSLKGLLLFAPFGAFTALFRPLPGEVMNAFGLLAGLENLALLLLTLAAAFRTDRTTMRQPLVLWGTLFVVTWASVYGFVSAYNLGGAVRFKLQVLPVLLGLLLYLTYTRAGHGSGGGSAHGEPTPGSSGTGSATE